jgi:hypothetical protein
MNPDIKRKRAPLGQTKAMIYRSIPFLSIIFVLGSWSAGFYTLQETQSIVPEVFRYLTFFGGLILSVVIGGLLGSVLSRVIRRRNPTH